MMKLWVGVGVHLDGYLLYTNTILNPTFNIISSHIWSLEKKENLHFNLLQLLDLNYDSRM